jgi:hypothetical protein
VASWAACCAVDRLAALYRPVEFALGPALRALDGDAPGEFLVGIQRDEAGEVVARGAAAIRVRPAGVDQRRVGEKGAE